MVFEVNLNREHNTPIWRSEGAEVNADVARLQKLFDENVDDGKAYADELEKLKNDPNRNRNFRLTEGKVFELFPSEQTLKVPIKLQVKEGVITWYFIAPHDVTKQDFRDEVYRSAALAHLRVENACEKYLRGTNALHVKKMHTSEEESGLNHNHYRLMEGHDVEPKDLRQHLMGFVQAQKELKLVAGDKEKYLDKEEAEEILRQYEKHWTIINHKGEAKTVEIAGEKIDLPKREKSLLEEYKAKEMAQWDDDDRAEWEQYKHLEMPCRSINPDTPVEVRLEAAAKGMRGIRSEVQHQRQIQGSRLKVLKTNYKMDDAVKETPEQLALRQRESKSLPQGQPDHNRNKNKASS